MVPREVQSRHCAWENSFVNHDLLSYFFDYNKCNAWELVERPGWNEGDLFPQLDLHRPPEREDCLLKLDQRANNYQLKSSSLNYILTSTSIRNMDWDVKNVSRMISFDLDT